jgi:hypothetical protein
MQLCVPISRAMITAFVRNVSPASLPVMDIIRTRISRPYTLPAWRPKQSGLAIMAVTSSGRQPSTHYDDILGEMAKGCDRTGVVLECGEPRRRERQVIVRRGE